MSLPWTDISGKPEGFATTANHVFITEATTDPTAVDLPSLSRFSFYMKNNKFVIAYNNGGTVTYISIPMDGSTTTWTHSTSAP